MSGLMMLRLHNRYRSLWLKSVKYLQRSKIKEGRKAMKKLNVILNVPKVDTKLVSQFRDFTAATVYEAAGQRGMMDPRIRPIYNEATVCGPALTVKCHVGDNIMIHKAVTIANPGDVLVVTIGNDVESGAWGEILTMAAQKKGVAGLVIDGAVRDSEAMKRRGFPVFSRGIAVGGTAKRNPGRINHPIVCGNVFIEPGDLVLGDLDGVVIVARELCEEVLHNAKKRQQRENEIMQKLEEGATTLSLLHLDRMLEEIGITEG